MTMSHPSINRRAVLQTLTSAAVGLGTSSVWVDTLIALAHQQAHSHAAQTAVAAQDWKPRVLSAPQNDLVVVLSELIIPETDTPGAKAVRVNRFIDTVLNEAPAATRQRFLKGLGWIDARSGALFKQPFAAAAPADQIALLTRLSAPGNPDKEQTLGREFFQAIKAMTINGYYTSEIGLRKELGDNGQLFLPKFEGCTHPEHQ
jgi:hypothetical protein